MKLGLESTYWHSSVSELYALGATRGDLLKFPLHAVAMPKSVEKRTT